MRALFLFASLTTIATLGGCNLIFDIQPGTLAEGGGGSAGTSTGGSTTTGGAGTGASGQGGNDSGGGGAGGCTIADDCPHAECELPQCNDGVCSVRPIDVNRECDSGKGRCDPSGSCLQCGSQTEFGMDPGVPFHLVCSRQFDMGCTGSMCGVDDSPMHQVTLTRSYWVQKTEVTVGQYQQIMGNNPSTGGNGCTAMTCPVSDVSWDDAAQLANKASSLLGVENCYDCSLGPCKLTSLDCNGFRLLTEAEWEGAARCGKDTAFAGASTPTTAGWFDGMAHPVGTKPENSCGLRDMSGNVWEWVNDWRTPYETSTQTDPLGLPTGVDKVSRGGSYNDTPPATVWNRQFLAPNYSSPTVGIRLARTFK